MSRRALADLALAFLTAVTVSLLLAPALPVADDWGLIWQLVDMRQAGFWHAVWQPQLVHWSPLWYLANHFALGAIYPDFSRVWLTAFRMGGLTALIAAALFILRRSGAAWPAAVACALLLGFHQADVAAFGQWKAIGTIGANAAAGWAAALLVDAWSQPERGTVRRGVIAGALTLAGLLFKETALWAGAFAAVVCVVPRVDGRVKRVAVGIIAGVVLFAALRTALIGPKVTNDPHMDVARYGWGGPREIAVNASELGAAALTPVSTIRWFDAARTHDAARIVVFALITIVVTVVIAAGVSRRRPFCWIVLAGLLSAGVPVVFLRHVSENYATAAIFWYAVAAGVAFDVWLARRARVAALVAVLVLIASVVCQATFFLEKRRIMIESSRVQTRTALIAFDLLRTVPRGAVVTYEVEAPPGAVPYSSYRVYSADNGVGALAKMDFRPELKIPRPDAPGDYRLTLRQGSATLTRMPPPAPRPATPSAPPPARP